MGEAVEGISVPSVVIADGRIVEGGMRLLF